MTAAPSKMVNDRFSLWLAAYYAAFFVAIGLVTPFFPKWLEARGLDAAAIGLVLAIPMVVRLAAMPAVAAWADRHGRLRAALIGCTFLSAAGYALVGVAQGVFWIAAALALASIVYTPLVPLADAYALKGLRARGGAYGPVRLWGSVTFMIANLGGGAMLILIAPVHLIWPIVSSLAVAALLSLALTPLEALPAGSAAPAAQPLLDRRFVTVALAASLIQASHAIYYGFSIIMWTAEGYGGMAIGALWALGVLAEICLFAMSGALPRWIGPAGLLSLGAIGAVLRWGAMALDPPAALLPVLQCLHALSYGATHLGAVQFMGQVAPERRGASAQAYLSVALGAGMALAMSVSGVLVEQLGAAAYGAMALAAIAGLALVWALPRGATA